MKPSTFPLHMTSARSCRAAARRSTSFSTSARRRITASVRTFSFRSGSSNVSQPIPRSSIWRLGFGCVVPGGCGGVWSTAGRCRRGSVSWAIGPRPVECDAELRGSTPHGCGGASPYATQADQAHERPDTLEENESVLPLQDRDAGERRRAHEVHHLVGEAGGTQPTQLAGAEGEED